MHGYISKLSIMVKSVRSGIPDICGNACYWGLSPDTLGCLPPFLVLFEVTKKLQTKCHYWSRCTSSLFAVSVVWRHDVVPDCLYVSVSWFSLLQNEPVVT